MSTETSKPLMDAKFYLVTYQGTCKQSGRETKFTELIDKQPFLYLMDLRDEAFGTDSFHKYVLIYAEEISRYEYMRHKEGF